MSRIHISKDKTKLDIPMIHKFLTNIYWAEGRTKKQVEKSVANSTCYGVYKDEEQIGFARIVTDRLVFLYLMDVFIIPRHQGNGYAKRLMQFIIHDPELQEVQQWYLRTRDAHSLYKQFGFVELEYPERTMIARPHSK